MGAWRASKQGHGLLLLPLQRWRGCRAVGHPAGCKTFWLAGSLHCVHSHWPRLGSKSPSSPQDPFTILLWSSLRSLRAAGNVFSVVQQGLRHWIDMCHAKEIAFTSPRHLVQQCLSERHMLQCLMLSLLAQAYGAFGLPSEPETNYLPAKKVHHGEGPAPSGLRQLSSETKLQVAVLIWTHSVIGWGFTLLQNWIPTILAALGMTDLGSVGIVSALPWVVSSYTLMK